MLKKNIKIIAALAILTSLNINCITVNASSAKNVSTVSEITTPAKNNDHKHLDYKSRLDELVKNNVITTQQENAALDLIKSDDFHKFMKKNHACSKNKLDTLVEKGTLTKEQKSSIKKVISSSKKQGKNFRSSINNGLDELVNNGTLTKDQKTEVEDLFRSCRKERIDNLNVFFKQKFDTLVKNGTITQQQEEAIIKSLIPFNHNS
ncbi:hypothetical protein [Clostridium kluyveri]|uniref:hypothetical protein n=1 Tax=Clostridium kluyveri TaxID=1534 RepID=UPI0022485A61|nr:hypothetical protein [Clostridium kluyveri]UZQ49459.1 hypothetical protein OP486_16085 [Clostridium kluyveri]